MIDWTKDVQVASLDKEDWESFVVIFPNEGHVYGHMPDEEQHDARMWHFDNWRFRNNPAEPKRVQAILKMWRSSLDNMILVRAYLKDKAINVASVRDWHPKKEGKLLSVIEIDLHEGEGLEGEK